MNILWLYDMNPSVVRIKGFLRSVPTSFSAQKAGAWTMLIHLGDFLGIVLEGLKESLSPKESLNGSVKAVALYDLWVRQVEKHRKTILVAWSILTCVCVWCLCVWVCITFWIILVYSITHLATQKPAAHRETPRAQLSSAGVVIVASGTWSATGQPTDLFAATFSACRNTGIPIPGSPHFFRTRENQQMKQRDVLKVVQFTLIHLIGQKCLRCSTCGCFVISGVLVISTVERYDEFSRSDFIILCPAFLEFLCIFWTSLGKQRDRLKQMNAIHFLKLKLTPARLRHLIRKLVFQPLYVFCVPCGPYVIGFGATLPASSEIFSIILFISLRCFRCLVDTCHAPWTAHSYRGVPHQTLRDKCQPLSVCWETSRIPKRKHVVVFTFPCVFHSQFELVQSLSQGDSDESHQLQLSSTIPESAGANIRKA